MKQLTKILSLIIFFACKSAVGANIIEAVDKNGDTPLHIALPELYIRKLYYREPISCWGKCQRA